MFHAEGRKYNGPEIFFEEKQIDATGKQFPVFLGTDSTLYNLDYFPIPKDRTDAQAERKDKKDVLENKSSYDAYKKSFPDPNKYESYFEFEQALIDWKIEVEGSIGYLQLPIPIGRNYFRPKVSLESMQVSLSFKM